MVTKPDLGAVLEHYGVRVVARHGWVPCRCVIHDDSHASAAYNLDNQIYNCLVCSLIGDVFDLVKKKEGLDFVSAKRKAEEFANGNSAQILQRANGTGSLLPPTARNNPRGGKYVPSWKRGRA